MVIFDNPATVPAPVGLYSHVARTDLGGKAILQLSGQVAIDADGNIVGSHDMAAQAEYIMDNAGHFAWEQVPGQYAAIIADWVARAETQADAVAA